MKVIKVTSLQDLTRLRRIALSAQGLLQSKPYGTGLTGARKAINHIGYVQIDTISVVERAHHHVLSSRVPNFQPAMTNQMLNNRDTFEYWTHAAAFIPIDDFRFSLPYKHALKSGQTHWYKTRDTKLMKELLARIRSDGPLRSRDLEANKKQRAGWWDWKPAKKALEQLYMEGDLMVTTREGFQKVYDLSERVLPDNVNNQMPSSEQFAEHIIEKQLACHGLISIKGLTYLRKIPELKQKVTSLINKKITQQALEQVQINDGEIFLTTAGSFESPLPRLSNRMLILSPFDNSVIQRDRLNALFHYDYKLECYLPAVKRQYGYFCLPLLFRDQFIGRLDCKAHRKERRLEIRFAHFEQHQFEEERVIKAFVDAIVQFSHFQQCNSVHLTKASSKHLTQALKTALKPYS